MKSFCIIGTGRFGSTLARTLSNDGYQVMIIDDNPDMINALSDVVTNAVVGDPANEAVLRASGIKNYDCAVICLSRNINDSILITLMLKELGVKKVVVRSISDLHTRVLEKIGADQIVFPERDMGEKVAYMLGRSNVLEYIEFSSDHSIVEAKIPRSWQGKTLAQLDIRRQYNVTVIAVNGEGDAIDVSPKPDRVFSAGESVALMGQNDDIDELIKNMN